jgi:hypothetical protein
MFQKRKPPPKTAETTTKVVTRPVAEKPMNMMGMAAGMPFLMNARTQKEVTTTNDTADDGDTAALPVGSESEKAPSRTVRKGIGTSSGGGGWLARMRDRREGAAKDRRSPVLLGSTASTTSRSRSRSRSQPRGRPSPGRGGGPKRPASAAKRPASAKRKTSVVLDGPRPTDGASAVSKFPAKFAVKKPSLVDAKRYVAALPPLQGLPSVRRELSSMKQKGGGGNRPWQKPVPPFRGGGGADERNMVRPEKVRPEGFGDKPFAAPPVKRSARRTVKAVGVGKRSAAAASASASALPLATEVLGRKGAAAGLKRTVNAKDARDPAFLSGMDEAQRSVSTQLVSELNYLKMEMQNTIAKASHDVLKYGKDQVLVIELQNLVEHQLTMALDLLNLLNEYVGAFNDIEHDVKELGKTIGNRANSDKAIVAVKKLTKDSLKDIIANYSEVTGKLMAVVPDSVKASMNGMIAKLQGVMSKADSYLKDDD